MRQLTEAEVRSITRLRKEELARILVEEGAVIWPDRMDLAKWSKDELVSRVCALRFSGPTDGLSV